MLAPVTEPTTPADPINRPTAVLTERGHAALAIVRLDDMLSSLEPDDQAYCLEMLREILDGSHEPAS